MVTPYLIFAGGLALGIAGWRRMKAQGRRGIQARAQAGVALGLMLVLWLAGFWIYRAGQAKREMEKQAELEARTVAAGTGGGAALEKELVERATQNFAAALLRLQTNFDSARAALTNPPLLDMALVKNRADLKARANAARRWILAGKELLAFSENMTDNYRQELRRHKLSPEAREAALKKLADALAPVTPTVIALHRAEVRKAEALLRLALLLDDTWGHWEYRPATQDLSFTDPKEAEAYNLAYQEFSELSGAAQSLQEQLRTVNK